MDNHTFENPLHPLLLQTLRLEGPCQNPAAFQSLTEAEWIALTGEAIRLRLAYAFDQFLHRHPDLMHRAPEICRERLKKTQRQTLLLNLKRQAQVGQMLEVCKAEGIPFLLMKGLWIVDQLYPNMSARASGDIDILLNPEDMPRFTRLLQREGYPLNPSIGDVRDIAQENNEFPLPTLDGTSRFDIHWSMTHPRIESPIDETKIWARSEIITLSGQPCRTLCLEDHLLLLCFHAAIHHRFQYVGPRALVDIGQAIKTPPRLIHWEDFVKRAREMGWDRGVWLMLDMVREHLGVKPPQSVLDALRPANAGGTKIREAALAAMFMDQQHKEVIGVEVVKLFSQAGWGGRIAHIYRRLFPAPGFIAGHFQLSINDPRLPWLYPWLYVKRWLWIIHNNLPKLARLAARDPEQKSELERSQTILRWLG